MQDPCLQVQDLLEVVHDHLQPTEPVKQTSWILGERAIASIWVMDPLWKI
jgi:hypothetical protein